MKLGELSKILALKLGDPVIEPDSDGAIFSSEMRKRYIERAYSKTVRMLKLVMKKYAPEFAKSLKVHKQVLKDDEKTGEEIEIKIDENLISVEEVKEVYVTLKNGNGYFASYISPSKYLSVKYHNNATYVPNLEKGDIYYTVISGKIYLLPISENKEYKQIEVVLSTNTFKYGNNDDELPLDTNYIDILITAAAIEGMEDLGRADKHQLYTATLAGQIQIIDGYVKFLEAKEGSEIRNE